VLDDLVRHFDEPFGDSSAIPTWYVSQLTRQHVTVALAGDGGDESFGGYRRYREIVERRGMPRAARSVLAGAGSALHGVLPRKAPGRRLLRSLGMDDRQYFAVGTRELETRELLSPAFLESLGPISTYNLLEPQMEQGDPTDRLSPYSSLDLSRYLPDDILVKVDRMSMAHALEVRAPFLDYRVVELAARMPYEWKISGKSSKAILKETFAADLPAEVLQPRKRGFSVPMRDWLRNELRPACEAALNDSELEQSGLFNFAEVRGLFSEHLSGARDRASLLWRFLFFQSWWQHHKSACRNTVNRSVVK
jgi:asparagine synthase (glutamine-hydrolysing)